jgi:hypothetical protein
MITQVKAAKEKHRIKMEAYAVEVREYVGRHGNDQCDYLRHRILMESYHRGAWNALNELLTPPDHPWRIKC